jgi:uncharacterized surface protein with fasciclin (FAS1) repeats
MFIKKIKRNPLLFKFKNLYMKYIIQKIKVLLLLIATAIVVLSSCNKAPEEFPVPPVVPPTGLSLGETLATTPTDSLYLRLIIKAGMVPLISNKDATYTMFVPDNNAMKLFISAISGGLIPLNAPDAVFSGFITANIPVANAQGIVGYNICGQSLPLVNIPATFPNLQYPTILNPAPSVSALLRLTTFPTTRNGAWINNIPLISTNIFAANGVIYNTAAVPAPPQRFLWDRISTDPNLTYLKAAINRADSGTAAPGFLQGILLNIGANLTVFAPTDLAFQATLTGAIYKALVAMGVPSATALAQATALASSPDVFSNPALYGVLTAQTVQGIVVYHMLANRAYTNNFPTTTTYYPTLLNGAVPVHPGIGLAAVFGAPFVTSATVKGVGNATPANVIINSTPLMPDPIGSSDQPYLNGVIQEINQVLLPQ